MVAILFFTKNHAYALARTLAPLVHDAVEGHVAEVIVVDSGSSDSTVSIADSSGCTVVKAGEKPLREVIAEARSDWVVVLEPGARLKEGWHGAVMDHIMGPAAAAACFRAERKGTWLERLFRPATARRGPLACGLVISRSQALANLSANASSGDDMIRGLAVRTLDAEIELAPAG